MPTFLRINQLFDENMFAHILFTMLPADLYIISLYTYMQIYLRFGRQSRALSISIFQLIRHPISVNMLYHFTTNVSPITAWEMRYIHNNQIVCSTNQVVVQGFSSGKCFKSIYPEGNTWFCKKCATHWPEAIPIQFNVSCLPYLIASHFINQGFVINASHTMLTISSYMYKLELNVVDNTNQSTFIVFSAEAEKMVDKDAPTLVQQIEQRVITV